MLLMVLLVVLIGICVMVVLVVFNQSIPSKESSSLRLNRRYYITIPNLQGGSIAPTPSDSSFVLGFIDERLHDNCYVKHECPAASQKIPSQKEDELVSEISAEFRRESRPTVYSL
jgi:hypothetical protein